MLGISNVVVGEEVFNYVSDMPMHENSLFKRLDKVNKLLYLCYELLTFVCIIDMFALTMVLNVSISTSWLFCLLKKAILILINVHQELVFAIIMVRHNCD